MIFQTLTVSPNKAHSFKDERSTTSGGNDKGIQKLVIVIIAQLSLKEIPSNFTRGFVQKHLEYPLTWVSLKFSSVDTVFSNRFNNPSRSLFFTFLRLWTEQVHFERRVKQKHALLKKQLTRHFLIC